MFYDNDLLKMKILMYFLQNDNSLCTVGKIADRLGSFKQKVSKMLIQMEQDGLVNRSDNRHPRLTTIGTSIAEGYTEKVKMTLEYLIEEGVSLETAEKDALNIVLLSSPSTIDMIKRHYVKNKIKKNFLANEKFTGDNICKLLNDGMYPLDFVIYRQHAEYNKNLSMANNGFEHPAYLHVENGIGTIKLKIKDLKAKAPFREGGMVKGQAAELNYFCDNKYVRASLLGRFISFPMEAMQFVTIGEGDGTKLHGSLFIKIKSTINTTYMPESEAVFTILI